jgi:hypothetical protein
MKKLFHLLSLCTVSAALLVSSGCVQNQSRTTGHYTVPRAPYIGSKEWLTWVDNKVDTRYANGNRPEPGTPEWYAVVDHVVFSDTSRDYYRNVYSREYNQDYQRYYRTGQGPTRRYNYASNTSGDYGYRGYSSNSGYKLGTLQWREAVTNVILTGKVPPPPPRSDPWDTPLTTTSDR